MARQAVPSTEDATARQTESRLRELDRKSAAASSNVEALLAGARHHWHGSGFLTGSGITQDITTWDVVHDDGVATFAAGALTLSQAGRWSLLLQMTSDATINGNSALLLAAATAALSPWGPVELRDERLRGSGYSNAGNLTQAVTWSGIVTELQAQAPIQPRAMWRNASGTVQATADWWLTAHYLGTARLPE